jgi:hypothetical protein
MHVLAGPGFGARWQMLLQSTMDRELKPANKNNEFSGMEAPLC